MIAKNKITLTTLGFVVASCVALLSGRTGDKYATITNAQAQEMLDTVKADILANYYDPQFHGLDVEKRFGEAREKIAGAKSQDEAFLDIAAAMAALKDSHTRFHPPVKPYGVDYGFLAQAVGDTDCYVTEVRPDSDAAAKGLKAGDRLLTINGISIVREDIRTVEYSYSVFPQSGFHLGVSSPDGVEQNLVTMAKVIPGQPMVRRSDVLEHATAHRNDRREDRSRYHAEGKQVLFWKLPDFEVDPDDVDGMLNKTRGYEVVVLDLRGNPGGRISALEKFLGGFFDRDVKIGDRRGRADVKQQIAKTRGDKAFGGKLIVLIDSKSISSAEIFARVIQLEKRGTVVGDRSAGAVRESRIFYHAVEINRAMVTQYGAWITVADLILGDGKSLENVGVTSDERVLPSPADIANGRDPVMARAAALAGMTMTPDEAAKIFPFEWPKEKMPEFD
jgi:C-terminal processing protease CtpA/Prc